MILILKKFKIKIKFFIIIKFINEDLKMKLTKRYLKQVIKEILIEQNNLANKKKLKDSENVYIAILIDSALNRFKQADYESSIWRLVDAAGIISKYYPNAIGVKQKTNRGYQIIKI